MPAVELEPGTCRCKIFDPYVLHKTYSQRNAAKLETCHKCCENMETFTVNQLLEICQKEPDCIINMYKASTSSERCLPDLTVDPKPVVEVQTEPPKNVEKATSARLNMGDSKYHYLMVDGSTNVAVPFDAETMSIDSNTWICERLNNPNGEVAYVCKRMQTKESREIILPEVQQKSSTKVAFAPSDNKESHSSIASKRTEKKSLSSIMVDTRRSIHSFFSGKRHQSRQKEKRKLAFEDQPSVLILRRSMSLPARKGRWSTTTDYEMLKFVVNEQKDKETREDTESIVSSTDRRGICAPIVRLFNSIKGKLRKRKSRGSKQSTHVIKVIYVEDDQVSINRSIAMKNDDFHL